METSIIKRSCVFGVLLISFAEVHAQSSVTLFGVVDAGLMYQNQNGGTGLGGKTKDSVTMFTGAGGSDYSQFGMLGQEDLGGGMQVGFKLAAGFNSGNGALATAGTLFNQESNVYFQSQYGRVTLGKQLDPAYLAMVFSDPRDAKHAYSAAGSWNFLQGNDPAPGDTVYQSNAVSYSYRNGGVRAGVLYRFGGIPGALSQGRVISAGVGYDNGSLIGNGGFLTKDDATGTRDLRVWEIGVGYRIKSVTIKALYVDYDLPLGNAVAPIGTTPPSHIIMAGGGVNWSLSPAQEITVAYYFTENRMDTTNATSMYVLSDDYSLSKRTKLYGYVGLMSAKKGANALTALTTAQLTSGYPDANTTTIGFGIQHRF
jgi:predicted porin